MKQATIIESFVNGVAMEKKAYEAPKMEVVDMKYQTILCDSDFNFDGEEHSGEMD